MKVHEYNEMMAYMLRPRQKFAIGGGVVEGENLGTREGFAKPIQLTWEKVTEDPLFEQFWKEEIDIANNPSKYPKKHKISKNFYKDLKKVIDETEYIEVLTKSLKKILSNFGVSIKDSELKKIIVSKEFEKNFTTCSITLCSFV